MLHVYFVKFDIMRNLEKFLLALSLLSRSSHDSHFFTGKLPMAGAQGWMESEAREYWQAKHLWKAEAMAMPNAMHNGTGGMIAKSPPVSSLSPRASRAPLPLRVRARARRDAQRSQMGGPACPVTSTKAAVCLCVCTG